MTCLLVLRGSAFCLTASLRFMPASYMRHGFLPRENRRTSARASASRHGEAFLRTTPGAQFHPPLGNSGHKPVNAPPGGAPASTKRASPMIAVAAWLRGPVVVGRRDGLQGRAGRVAHDELDARAFTARPYRASLRMRGAPALLHLTHGCLRIAAELACHEQAAGDDDVAFLRQLPPPLFLRTTYSLRSLPSDLLSRTRPTPSSPFSTLVARRLQ